MNQFIVISKGSERVAEVAARFTLDAMPGKQMSIDAELRAGHIDHNEAMLSVRLSGSRRPVGPSGRLGDGWIGGIVVAGSVGAGAQGTIQHTTQS
jgi:FHIPEP family